MRHQLPATSSAPVGPNPCPGREAGPALCLQGRAGMTSIQTAAKDVLFLELSFDWLQTRPGMLSPQALMNIYDGVNPTTGILTLNTAMYPL